MIFLKVHPVKLIDKMMVEFWVHALVKFRGSDLFDSPITFLKIIWFDKKYSVAELFFKNM